MEVPLLDLTKQYETIRDDVREAIDRVCESQYFILGPEVKALEGEIAQACGVKAGIGVSSGTDALLVSLMAAGVGPGDEVITTTYSFFATAGVIDRLEAVPVFVDIDPATYNIDAHAVAGKVTDRTKAIIPVHLYGRMADMDPIMDVAREHGPAVIEDAAQSIGSFDDKDRQAGSIGDYGCFSFFPSKNLGAFGDGGMVITDDDRRAELVRRLRVHGGKPKYYHSIVGGNFRLDAIQAAVLRVKFPHLPAWTEARRENADRYRELFLDAGIGDQVVLPDDVPGHIYNQFVLDVGPRRDELREFLKSHGIGNEVYYPVPLHLQECFWDLGYGEGDFPHAEKAANQTVAIPVYPELTDDQQRYVVDKVVEFFSN